MKRIFVICALVVSATVFAFGETSDDKLVFSEWFSGDAEVILLAYQTPFDFSSYSETSLLFNDVQTSRPYSIYCRIHKKEAYYKKQEGYGRTCTWVYSHRVYANYPEKSYEHQLLVDCS